MGQQPFPVCIYAYITDHYAVVPVVGVQLPISIAHINTLKHHIIIFWIIMQCKYD